MSTPAKSAVHARVRINPLRCVRFGFCSEFCPEVFDLDDWGYARMHGAEVGADLLELVRSAAALCPTGAIDIELVAREVEPAGKLKAVS